VIRVAQALDSFSNPLFGGIQQSDTIYAIALAANTSQQVQVPTGANAVNFSVSGGTDFYMKFTNAVIAVPSSNVIDGSAPELNPQFRSCAGKTYVNLISAANCVVTIAFYA